MGWADMLIQLGIPYDSDEAIELGKEVMEEIQVLARQTSRELGVSRGVYPFWNRRRPRDNCPPQRNATLTTIAPTGSLSIIAGCSSGIEPLFALAHQHAPVDGGALQAVVNPYLVEALHQNLEPIEAAGVLKRVEQEGVMPDIGNPPWARAFRTARDIDPQWHVEMQAIFQAGTDNAVSKTINLPYEATPQDVENVYLMAYQFGCKGLTVYRDGSRSQQVLTVPGKKTQEPPRYQQPSVDQKGDQNEPRDGSQDHPAGEPDKGPAETGAYAGSKGPGPTSHDSQRHRIRNQVERGTTHKVATGCGNLYVTINADQAGPIELMTFVGKANGCVSAQCEAITRLTSLALRYQLPTPEIVHQLRRIRCPQPTHNQGGAVLSCPDALGRVLEEYCSNASDRNNHAGTNQDEEASFAFDNEAAGRSRNVAGQCPECSSLLQMSEGCVLCQTCGWSRCG